VAAYLVELIEAAGGVVWRRSPATGQIEVLVVHRPKYDDWSLPKGKLEAGETHEAGAVREVEEETGLVVALGPELAATSYRDSQDRPKVVRYWAMEAVGGQFAPNREVDAVRWARVGEAARLLSYDRDRDVLASLGR